MMIGCTEGTESIIEAAKLLCLSQIRIIFLQNSLFACGFAANKDCYFSDGLLNGIDLGRFVCILMISVLFQGRKDEASIEMLSCNDIDEDVCKGVVTEWCDHSAKVHKPSHTSFQFCVTSEIFLHFSVQEREATPLWKQ